MNGLSESLDLAVADALARARIDHGILTVKRIPPSRSIFVTDDEAVFVKVSREASDHEYLVARHLRRLGFPTPEVLAPPVALGDSGWCALTHRFHSHHTDPVTSAEAGALVGTLWALPRPSNLAPPGWEHVVTHGLDNITHVADIAVARRLSDLLVAASDAVDAARRAAKPPLSVFCHGDLHYRNVLRAADGTAMLLDWEWAGLGWPEMECAKFLQASIAEPACAGYASDPDTEGFLAAATAVLGRGLDHGLLDACVRLRAAHAATYQVRWGLTESLPAWHQRSLAVAALGLAASLPDDSPDDLVAVAN